MSEAFKTIQEIAGDAFREHQISQRLDYPGPFRSYRCQKPGTWIYGFDVTFTPGWVYLSGDIGHLALSREKDMMPWLRGVLTKGSIDLRYVAEKSPHRSVTREWSEWGAKRMLDSIFESRDIASDHQAELRREATDRYEWETLVIPELVDLGVHDFYEYGDASDWSSEFCWCVLGLKWFIEAFDRESNNKD